MAELIPIAYRVRVAQRTLVARWTLYGAGVLLAASAGLASLYAWQRTQANTLSDLRTEFRERSTLIARSRESCTKREKLAKKMRGIQQLRDDNVLLALLHNSAASFAERDCLEQIKVDARGPGGDGHYVVRITGVTGDSATLASLMKRLSTDARPGVNVILESSKREQYLDGHVMRFQIVCEKPGSQG